MQSKLVEDPIWITKKAALAIHELQIAEHGGLRGVRDEGLLESALARPENLYAYGVPVLVALAAAYAFGIAKNHPFNDGNKRTSLAVCLAFLDVNGSGLSEDDEAVTATWLALAAGDLNEVELSTWLAMRLGPVVV